jgi:hypothetical protein
MVRYSRIIREGIMILTIFKNTTEARVAEVIDDDWNHIIKLLLEHDPSPIKEDVLMYNLVEFRTADDPLCEPGRRYHYVNGQKTEKYDIIFNTVRRCKNNVVGLWGIILDYDGGATVEQAITQLTGLEYVLYTTFRHSPELNKFRVVIPFSRPLLAADIRGRQRDIRSLFPQVDAASFSMSQSFYFHSGATDPIAYHNQGTIIDPYEFAVEVINPYVPSIAPTWNTSFNDVAVLLDELQRHYPVLPYTERTKITWAVRSQCDSVETIDLMRSRWPDAGLNGKYETAVAAYEPGRTGMQPIYGMIRQYNPEFRVRSDKQPNFNIKLLYKHDNQIKI